MAPACARAILTPACGMLVAAPYSPVFVTLLVAVWLGVTVPVARDVIVRVRVPVAELLRVWVPVLEPVAVMEPVRLAVCVREPLPAPTRSVGREGVADGREWKG